MNEEASQSNTYGYWYKKGSEQLDSEEYLESITSFNQALRYKLDDRDSWYKLGNAHFFLGDYNVANFCYEQSLLTDKNNQNAWESQGLTLSQLQRYSEAIVKLERALELQPNLFRARWGKGNALMELGRIKEAISDYEKVLESQPNCHAVWSSCGEAYMKIKQYSDALNCYKKVIELSQSVGDRRTEAEALLATAPLHIFNGRTQDAFATYNKAYGILAELSLPSEDPLSSIEHHQPFFPEHVPLPPVMNLWGRLVGYGIKGRIQMFMVFIVWLSLVIPLLSLTWLWGKVSRISRFFT
jgi:tetratricopeptide (TPR) repeat protein